MQIELSKRELETINEWIDKLDVDTSLAWRFKIALDEAEELESIDLNDCGDSCKL